MIVTEKVSRDQTLCQLYLMDIRDCRQRHVQRAGTSHSSKTTGPKVPFYCTDSSQGLEMFLQWCFVCFLTCAYGCKILDCKYCIKFLFNDWSSVSEKTPNKNSIKMVFGMSVFLYLMPGSFIRGVDENFLLKLFHILFLWYDESIGFCFFCFLTDFHK